MNGEKTQTAENAPHPPQSTHTESETTDGDNGDLILPSVRDIDIGKYVGVAWEEGCSFGLVKSKGKNKLSIKYLKRENNTYKWESNWVTKFNQIIHILDSSDITEVGGAFKIKSERVKEVEKKYELYAMKFYDNSMM